MLKIALLLMSLVLTGCANVPFDIEFNYRNLKQKPEKLVLGRQINPKSTTEPDELKLKLSSHPRLVWQRRFN